MKSKKIAALVPMRHHSQRVPRKNYRDLAGKPLFHYIIKTLLECKIFDPIAIDTDSQVILDDVKRNFPDILRVVRPDELRGDQVPMNEILLYDTQEVLADFYLQTHSTNPFLSAASILKAIRAFMEHTTAYDSLFSVTRISTRLWDEKTQPINHDPDILLQTQDLPPIFEENSCMYIFSAEKLRTRKNRIGEKPMMFEISGQESLDIDDENDFLIADLLMRYHKKSKLV